MSDLGSASGIGRAMACPASKALPQSPRENVHQHKGNAVHDFLAAVPVVGREAALEQVPEEYRDRCAVIDLDSLPPMDTKSTAAEVAFVYDLATDTAQEVGRNIGRAYPELGPTQIAGTADVVALTADGEGVIVWDWKSPHHHVASASENWQLRTLALMAARAYGRTRATVAIIKLREDGSSWWDPAEFDEMDLDGFAATLERLRGQVVALRASVAAGKTPDVIAGAHCRYCPAFQACPGQTSLVRALASDPAGVGAYIEPLQLTPQTAAKAYARLRQVKTALRVVSEALEAYAQEHPIPLPDGSVYGPVETAKEEVDGAKAFEILTRLYGPDAAAKGCEYGASKASIERAMRVVQERERLAGRKATLKDLVGGTLEALRKTGGIAKKTSVSVKEHRE